MMKHLQTLHKIEAPSLKDNQSRKRENNNDSSSDIQPKKVIKYIYLHWQFHIKYIINNTGSSIFFCYFFSL